MGKMPESVSRGPKVASFFPATCFFDPRFFFWAQIPYMYLLICCCSCLLTYVVILSVFFFRDFSHGRSLKNIPLLFLLPGFPAEPHEAFGGGGRPFVVPEHSSALYETLRSRVRAWFQTPDPHTQTPHPYTPVPKRQTPNAKTETRNPKPETSRGLRFLMSEVPLYGVADCMLE